MASRSTTSTALAQEAPVSLRQEGQNGGHALTTRPRGRAVVLRALVAWLGWLGIGYAASAQASAQAKDSVGKLGALIGKAFVVRDGERLPAKKGMGVFASDALVTEPRAVVKIQFADGGTFMAFENSSVTIEEYDVKRQGDKISLKSAFDIAKGKVRFFVKPGQNRQNEATYKTKNAVMGIRGTSGFIETNGSKTQLVVTTGKVEVKNPGNPSLAVMVPANHLTQVVGASAPSKPQAAPPGLLKNLNKSAEQVGPAEANSEAAGEDKGGDNKGEGKSESKDNKGKSESKDNKGKDSDARKSESENKADNDEGSGQSLEKNGGDDGQGSRSGSDQGSDKKTGQASESKPEQASSGGSSEVGQSNANRSESIQKSEANPVERSEGSAAEPAPTKGEARPAQGSAANARPRAGAPAGADTQTSQQNQVAPAAPVKKVVVFGQDGGASVSVSDSSAGKVATTVDKSNLRAGSASRSGAPASAGLPAPVSPAEAAGAAAAVRQIQGTTTATQQVQQQILQTVTESLKQTTTAIEAAKEAAAPVATPPPPPAASKTVRVKVVLPQP